MTPLRRRMREDLPLRGLSDRPQGMSGRAVRQLAEQDPQFPARLTADERRDDGLSLTTVTPSSRSARTSARGGITLFSTHPWPREWTPLTFVRPPRAKKLPVLLRPMEVRTLLACVQRPHDRGGLATLDAGGLRLQAGTHLQVRDRDSARMCLHVRLGKGA